MIEEGKIILKEQQKIQEEKLFLSLILTLSGK